jgi:hypothetical protein
MLRHVRAFVFNCGCTRVRSATPSLSIGLLGQTRISSDHISPRSDTSRCSVFVPNADDDIRAAFPHSLEDLEYTFDDSVGFILEDKQKYNQVVGDIMKTIDDNYLTESLILATDEEDRSKIEKQILGLLAALRASSGIEPRFVVTRTKFYQAVMAHRVIRLANEISQQYFRKPDESM